MSNANEPWKNKNIEIFVIKTASSRLWDVKFSMGVNLLFLAISIFSHFSQFWWNVNRRVRQSNAALIGHNDSYSANERRATKWGMGKEPITLENI